MMSVNLFNINGSIGKSCYGATDFANISEFLSHLDYLDIQRSLLWHISARDLNPLYGNRKLLDEIEEAGAEERIFPAFIITPACFYGNNVLTFLKKHFREKQVRAIRLTPEACCFPIRRIERVLAELEEFSPLVIWDVSKHPDNQAYLDIEYLAHKFSNVKFALTQIMWPPFGAVLDLLWRSPNTCIDISRLHMRGSIELLCKDFGAERVLFGIDYKAHYGAAIAELAFAQISKREKKLIASSNLEKLLSLPASKHRFTSKSNGNSGKKLWHQFRQGKALENIKIIDAHAHDQIPTMGWYLPEMTLKENVESLLAQAKRLKVKQIILSSGLALFGDGVLGNYETEKAFTNHTDTVKGYLAFNPRFSRELVPLLDNFFSRDFYIGFKLLASYWKIPLTDHSYNPVWEYADKYHLPILLHTWDDKCNSPAMLAKIVKKYPGAFFLLGHSGGGTSGRLEAVELAKNNDNVYLEFCGSFTTPELFENAIKEVGNKKILFGSDTIAHSQAWELGRFLSLPIDDAELLPALAKNMEQILEKRILKTPNLLSLRDLTFKSNCDDSEQRYLEILPKQFNKNKTCDLIIALHGHGADRWQYALEPRAECQSLRDTSARYNMIAILPDYRAKTSWMGPAAEADTLQIIEEIKNKYKINKVFLVGGSMGGSAALTFAALHPALIDGVTAMNPLANHLEYKNFQTEIAKSFGKNIREEKEKRSAEFHSEKLTMPIAFTTGGKDDSVPGDSAHRLFAKLKKAKQKVLLIHRPETGHETNFEDAMTAFEFMYNSTKL